MPGQNDVNSGRTRGTRDGGRQAGMFVSGVTTVAGLACMATGFLGPAGVALVGAGVSGFSYSANETDESFNDNKFFRKSVIGAATSLATAGIGATSAIGQAASNATTSGLVTAVENIADDGQLDGEKVVKNVIKGAISGGVGGVASNYIPAYKTDNLLESTGRGLTVGAVSSAGGQMANNLVEERPDLRTNVAESYITGAVVGATLGAVGHVQKNSSTNRSKDFKDNSKKTNTGPQNTQSNSNPVRSNPTMTGKKINDPVTPEAISNKQSIHDSNIAQSSPSPELPLTSGVSLSSPGGSTPSELPLMQNAANIAEYPSSVRFSGIPLVPGAPLPPDAPFTFESTSLPNAPAAFVPLTPDASLSFPGGPMPTELPLMQGAANIAKYPSPVRFSGIPLVPGAPLLPGAPFTFDSTLLPNAPAALENLPGGTSGLSSIPLSQMSDETINPERQTTQMNIQTGDDNDSLNQRQTLMQQSTPSRTSSTPQIRTDGLSQDLGQITLDLLDQYYQSGLPGEVDCDWEELKQHIVLVHAIEELDSQEIPLFKVSVSADARIGSHLNLDGRCLADGFIANGRPHTHWAWNQLVQSHGQINNWENDRIAILEPFCQFDRDMGFQPYAVAPYDTMVIGEHKLSTESIILVPQDIEEVVRSYLESYEGRIRTYNHHQTSLRQAIFDTLNAEYPQVWHMCNSRGDLVGDIVQQNLPLYYLLGYQSYPLRTYIKTNDTQIIQLFRFSGEQDYQRLSRSMQQAHDNGQRLMIHNNSVTFELETNHNAYFQFLQRNITRIDLNGSPEANSFAGRIERPANTIKNLGILKAYNIYRRLRSSPSNTGAHMLADYVIFKAFYADYVSVLQEQQITELVLYRDNNPRPAEAYVRLLIHSVKDPLLNAVRTLSQACQSVPTQDGNDVQSCFRNYRQLLVDSLNILIEARSMLVRTLSQPPVARAEDANINAILAVVDDHSANANNNMSGDDLFYERAIPNEYLNMFQRLQPHLPHDTGGLTSLHHALSNLADNPARVTIVIRFLELLIQTIIFDEYLNNSPRFRGLVDLSRFGLRAATIPASQVGNCLFDSIAALIDETISPNDLRTRLGNYMEENRDSYIRFFIPGSMQTGIGDVHLRYENYSEYIAVISRPGSWVGEREIAIMANMLQRPIVLLKDHTNPSVYNQDNRGRGGMPIFIRHVRDNHFCPLLPAPSYSALRCYNAIINNDSHQALIDTASHRFFRPASDNNLQQQAERNAVSIDR